MATIQNNDVRTWAQKRKSSEAPFHLGGATTVVEDMDVLFVIETNRTGKSIFEFFGKELKSKNPLKTALQLTPPAAGPRLATVDDRTSFRTSEFRMTGPGKIHGVVAE
jgi:hypothetical protein